MANWWETFCDGDYLRFWEGAEDRERTAREVASLWSLLGLREGSRVLDASCGYGRIARPLAEQAARVPGVDFSAGLLGEAERRRGGISADRLRYQRLDLRLPLEESGFDVALTVFSSLGYGTEGSIIPISLSNAIKWRGNLRWMWCDAGKTG